MMRTTHTYSVLDLSEAAYQEIRRKLEHAGYSHAFHEEDGRALIDMHGIAVASGGIPCAAPHGPYRCALDMGHVGPHTCAVTDEHGITRMTWMSEKATPSHAPVSEA